MRQRFTAPLLLCLLILGQFILSTAFAQSDLDDEAKSLIVMVNGYWGDSESLGAGIVFGAQRGRLYIATADHVIRPRENNFQEVETVEVEFFFRPGEVFTAEVLRPLSEGLDLAVISMPIEGTDIFPSQFPFHRFGDNFVLERSDQMFTVGQGGGRAWNTLRGLVNILENEEGFIDLQFSDVTRGDSGGAVFSEAGEL
ncbi:MAG: serine protease, partial [Deinococcota bacterium]